MTEIYLIRHGQTHWNTQRRFQGHTDIDLNDLGIDQAKRLQERLKDTRIDAFYSSDLKRAHKTALLVARPRAMTVTVKPALKEICFGDWEGKKIEDIQKDSLEESLAWFENPATASIPQGETNDQVLSRVVACIKGIAKKHAGQRVAIFSHGGPIRYGLLGCLNLPFQMFWKMDIDNTSISVLRWERDSFHLHCVNDCAHLLK